jgi:hypothetical protein
MNRTTTTRSQFVAAMAATAILLFASSAKAAVSFTTQATAVQQVNLLGIAATLVANGQIDWTFDLDSNGNTVGTASTINSHFAGILPAAFGPLAGLPFDLFSNDPELVTVTGNGTHVSVDTTFGLIIPGVAEFFTTVPSDFSAIVSGIPFGGGIVFESLDPKRPNDLTQVFIGANGLQFPNGGPIPSGTLVGVSFDRTVTTTTPEPASLLGWLGASLLVLAARNRGSFGKR